MDKEKTSDFAKYNPGDRAYIVESNLYLREVEVVRLLLDSALSGSWIVAAGSKSGRTGCFLLKRLQKIACRRRAQPRSHTGITDERKMLG